MGVRANALIWVDGRLILAEAPQHCGAKLSLPGARVEKHESVLEALKRGVAAQTGLGIRPVRLVYVSERIEPACACHLRLIFVVEPCGVPRLNGFRAINLDAGERPPVRPAILDLIASDAATGWRDAPRWLRWTRSNMSRGW